MKNKYRLKKKFRVFLNIYFIFFALSFTTLTFSKYIGVVEGEGNKTVAKWEVLVDDSGNNPLYVVSGNNTQNYILRVTNTSEVGVDYTISLTNVPDNVLVSLDGGSNTTPTNGEITYSGNLEINANDTSKTKTHTLTFSSLLEANPVTNNQVQIDVLFTQKTVN